LRKKLIQMAKAAKERRQSRLMRPCVDDLDIVADLEPSRQRVDGMTMPGRMQLDHDIHALQ
jgi:hypothetical protein